MRNTCRLPTNMVEKMNRAFFELSPGGLLVYQDPAIGPLANRAKQLAVELNLDENQLELRVGGRVSQSFKLDTDVADACQTACQAYFSTFANLCANAGADLAAA